MSNYFNSLSEKDKLNQLGLKNTGQVSETDTANADGSSATDKLIKVDWKYLDSGNSNLLDRSSLK